MRVLGAPSAPRPRTSDGSPSRAATACWTASASSRMRPFIGRPTAFLDIELCPLPREPPDPSRPVESPLGFCPINGRWNYRPVAGDDPVFESSSARQSEELQGTPL